jgi:DNA-binding MarR family transcriptional regulator
VVVPAFPSDDSAAAVLGAVRAHVLGDAGPRLQPLLALLGASRHLGSWAKRELGRSAQTECGFRVLAHLAAHTSGLVTPLETATATGLPGPVITEILGRLEVSGLIAQGHRTGRRTELTLILTAAGRKAFGTACRDMRASLAQLLSALPTRELATLERVCTHLDHELNRAAGSPQKSLRHTSASGRISRRSIRRQST